MGPGNNTSSVHRIASPCLVPRLASHRIAWHAIGPVVARVAYTRDGLPSPLQGFELREKPFASPHGWGEGWRRMEGVRLLLVLVR